MKTYWLVETSYYDDGTISARLVGSIRAEDCPENEKVSTSEMDIYRDWFASRAYAERFVDAVPAERRYGGRHE
ncbi:MAG: hypothetical protein LBJ41_01710 [Treponema sp.]|jgi:hypothetical protein|nr:hypothetical protein [Treponema sp.]